MIRRRRIVDFTRESTISVVEEATAGPAMGEVGARGGQGELPRAPGRQAPGRWTNAPRLAERGSSPVRAWKATGMYRRRVTPSFARRVSAWAFAVRGEMPRRAPTSSFEQPAAIKATTSRWRRVRIASLSVMVCVMAREATVTRSGEPFPRRCNPGCNHYEVHPEVPLRHPLQRDVDAGTLLRTLGPRTRTSG